jgi:surface protein
MTIIKKETAVMFALFVLALMFLYIYDVPITGKAVLHEGCSYYYEKWGSESWFNTWNWWNENCDGFFDIVTCGNGLLEKGEMCDTNQLIDCRILGFESGMMSCVDCMFYTGNCVGNNIVDYNALIGTGAELQECLYDKEKCIYDKNSIQEAYDECLEMCDDDLEPFTFQIQTNENNQEFRFQIDNAGGMEIDWGLGDGWERLSDGSAIRAKTYPSEGIYNIKLKGEASRIAFDNWDLNQSLRGTPKLLKDILTPISNSISGLTSASEMFGDINIESFSANNFFDEVSRNVIDMKGMFSYSQFNQDISNWDVSNVQDMGGMFSNSQFNQNISNWNVSNVNDMSYMFSGATNFNQPLNQWDVSNVQNMIIMFSYSSFNQDISMWNVSNVKYMRRMFAESSFDQDISQWNINNLVDLGEMFEYSALSTENYDKILIGWASQSPNLNDYVMLGAEGISYCDAEDARQLLIDEHGWTITDAGKDCN